MKVLIVCRDFTNPLPLNEKFELLQAKALAQAGVDVVVACLGLSTIKKLPKYQVSHDVYDGISLYDIKGPTVGHPIWLGEFLGARGLWKLYNHIFPDGSKPDVIHAHFSIYLGLLGTHLARRINRPLVVTEYSTTLMEMPKTHPHNRASCRTYQLSDEVIAISNPLSKRIHDFCGVNCEVIPLMLDSDTFADAKRNDEAGFGFITTGSLIARKNHTQLIDAFAAVHSKHKDTRLGIIGRGPLDQSLREYAAALGIADAVRFYGHVSHSEMATIYNSYDCFVFPSLYETLGVAPIEAMASGMPVIASISGGPEDYITDETGILVKNNDLHCLTEAMMRMYDSYGKYDRHKIRAYANANFAPEHISRRIIDVYEKVCSKFNG